MSASSFIPGETAIFVPAFTVYRSTQPAQPLPLRHILAQSPQKEGRKNVDTKLSFMHETSTFHAFSIGPASCVGKNLTWAELRCLCVLHAELRLQA